MSAARCGDVVMLYARRRCCGTVKRQTSPFPSRAKCTAGCTKSGCERNKRVVLINTYQRMRTYGQQIIKERE